MMKLSPGTLMLLLAPLWLANCKSTRSSTGSTGSGTPSHNMSRSEYPFDENGNYHEEWVKGDSGNVVDLTKNNPPSVFKDTTDARDLDRPPTTKPRVSSSGGGSSKPTASKSKPKPKPVTKAKPKPPAPKFTTVTVKKGDTLYGLSSRYGASVKAIQAANGMGSATTLRDGKVLKIPK